MALILNIETATTTCSVVLSKDGDPLASKESSGEYKHAENLTPFIEDVLKQAGYSLKDLSAVAVSKGPGSYTGLRIGVSTAKGLCFALNKPLIGVETLEAMANQFAQNNRAAVLLCPMIDARRMEVYCAVYDNMLKVIKPTAAEIIDEHSFRELLDKNKIIFFGDGAEKCKAILKKHENALFADDFAISATGMTGLAAVAFKNEKFEDLAYFEPFYLKDFVGTTPKKN